MSNSRLRVARRRPDRSKLVRKHLEVWGERARLHFRPKYTPDTNPVEEVWWRQHEAVTRNHRCGSMQEMIELTMGWLDEWRYFRVHRHIYNPGELRRPSGWCGGI